MTRRQAVIELALRAEKWTVKLFQALGYSVTHSPIVEGFQIDLVVRKDDLSHPVEVKLRPATLFGMHELAREALRLRTITTNSKLTSPILVLFGMVSRQARSWSQNEYGFRLWDIDVLREKAQPFPNLLRELNEIVAGSPALPILTAATKGEAERLIEQLEDHLRQNTLSPSDYEKLCQEVFVYLFDPDLYGFQRQSQTTDGANRYDFICRIKPGNSFWDAVRNDFRTRAILFECKNYEQGIGPDQVYSTERYLFTGGLRTVCFLISRMPPTDGALRAAQGAMREAGKLILLLSNSDLIAMIKLKGEPGGPENYLDERIWKFVISLPR
ncbi:hypothetical protein C2U70_05780 [Bradyrhizobium guangdongense]|uniref:restriction endonuclease n=1 Tax=Bradyrhizobium guangdongense TaxID=1325090 RepID=UPI00112A7780|nr:restriction endonuclease [Bradyrhizobium guangdongense]TPQ40119.1 hypothetical protein C2U70_05780 [Bradyrhizobium guangdongense]